MNSDSRCEQLPDPLGQWVTPNLLITAGPSYEPIDAVRFIGNRSSGKLGVAIAEQAARSDWNVTLLLGPGVSPPQDSRITVERFRTCHDLRMLLLTHQARTDALIMAAAVADFTPANPIPNDKMSRESGLTLELVPTPDLIAECVERKEPHQTIVGFSLTSRDRLISTAHRKLDSKGLDLIVANPLETMDSDLIDAIVIAPDGSERSTGGPISKSHFASWLLALLGGCQPTSINPVAAYAVHG